MHSIHDDKHTQVFLLSLPSFPRLLYNSLHMKAVTCIVHIPFLLGWWTNRRPNSYVQRSTSKETYLNQLSRYKHFHICSAQTRITWVNSKHLYCVAYYIKRQHISHPQWRQRTTEKEYISTWQLNTKGKVSFKFIPYQNDHQSLAARPQISRIPL